MARTAKDSELDECRSCNGGVAAEPGIVHLTCEAGHPWMRAYVFVADHPYVTVTGDNGEFVLDDVPVRTRQLTMWHEGIRLERNLKSLQRYEYEEPYERTREVVVTEGAETVVEIELSLRALAP